MRAVVQCVNEARVEVNENRVSAIETGLLVYLGVQSTDELADVEIAEAGKYKPNLRHFRSRGNDPNAEASTRPSFRPSAARAGIQPALAAATCFSCKDRLDSRPGLLSAGVTFFRGNDAQKHLNDVWMKSGSPRYDVGVQSTPRLRTSAVI